MPVGLSARGIALARTLALIVVAADARLTEVVETCPNHIAHDVRVVVHCCPVAEGISRIALRLPHHTLGVALVVAGVFENHVVVAGNIKYVEVRVVDFPVAVPRTKGLGDGACVIYLQNGILQQTCGMDNTQFLTFYDLVAQAPRDDAGMVAVAQNHCVNILAIARVDEGGVVVLQLGRAPTVEGFTDNQHAQRVASIEERTRGGIVRGTDEVETSLLHQSHFANLCSVEGSCSEYTVVVMHAGTVQEHRLTIEHKAFLSIERERADSVFCRLTVNCLILHHLLQFHGCLIEVWVISRPQFRVLDGEGCCDALCAMSRYFYWQNLTQGGLQLCAVNDNGCCTFIVRLIFDGHLHVDGGFVGLHLGCCDEHTVLGNMQRRHGLEPHMAVDARAGIPAAVGLQAVVNCDKQFVRPFVLI